MYHSFIDDEGGEYGSFEVFEVARGFNEDCILDPNDETRIDVKIGNPVTEVPEDSLGWHWWACFPGCMPDGDPVGPFDTEREAIEDAQQS